MQHGDKILHSKGGKKIENKKMGKKVNYQYEYFCPFPFWSVNSNIEWIIKQTDDLINAILLFTIIPTILDITIRKFEFFVL